jgi:hypothetical protein
MRRIEIISAGDPPPCQRPDFSICRGCSGWAAMLSAAEEDPVWRRTPIHCTVTGLTVRLEVEEVGVGDKGSAFDRLAG